MQENIETDYHVNISRINYGEYRIIEKNQWLFIVESKEEGFAFTYEIVGNLIETLDSVIQIHEEGRVKRAEAEKTLQDIEKELKAKMLEINSCFSFVYTFLSSEYFSAKFVFNFSYSACRSHCPRHLSISAWERTVQATNQGFISRSRWMGRLCHLTELAEKAMKSGRVNTVVSRKVIRNALTPETEPPLKKFSLS